MAFSVVFESKMSGNSDKLNIHKMEITKLRQNGFGYTVIAKQMDCQGTQFEVSARESMANKHLLGYQYDEEQKKYIIIPEEAEAVRWMFQMYIDSVSLHGIAKNMNRAGIRSVLGNEFQEGSVRQMIFNEVYAGDIRRQKCYMADSIKKTKVKNCGELPQYYMPGCHEAIIDRETYA